MNLFQQNRAFARDARHRKGRLLFATVLIIVILLLDAVSGGKLRAIVRATSSYVWSAGSGAASFVTESGIFATKHGLEKENSTLRQEITDLQLQIAGEASLKEQNAALQNIVHLTSGEKGITVPIVSSVLASPYGTFEIGGGGAEGVTTGSIVLEGNGSMGFIIGQVSEAEAHHALVEELLAPGAKTNVTIRGIPLSLEGQGGGNGRAQSPRGSSIAAGDVVFAPTLGERAIAIVGTTSAERAAAIEDVYVRLPIPLSALQFVYVIAH